MTTAEAATSLDRRIQEAAARVDQKVIACRRDIHQNPELGNREFRTAKLIAAKLNELGIETKTGVAHTGVIGVLRGGKPGRVVALRADMDALPVTEEVKVPFASKVRTTYNDQEVGVGISVPGHVRHHDIATQADRVLDVLEPPGPGGRVLIEARLGRRAARSPLPATVKWSRVDGAQGPMFGVTFEGLDEEGRNSLLAVVQEFERRAAELA